MLTGSVSKLANAFEKSRDVVAAGKGGGRITKELVAQYEETLKGYQAKAAEKKK